MVWFVESRWLLSSELISVVVPAFNSERCIAITVARITQCMESLGKPYELIIVNDGSSDNTWSVLQRLAKVDLRIIAINLLRNYGQHSALMCGLRNSSGNFVVTMDDDLQNPPEEIPRLLKYCVEGNHDLVIGEFVEPMKARFRVIGTDVVNRIVTRVFNKPSGLKLSTFRVIRRDVVDRVCQSINTTPYITGELLFAAGSIANVSVRHDEREFGKSTYSPFKILNLLRRITFSYSIDLLRISCRIGTGIALITFLFSAGMLIRGSIVTGSAPGWTSMVITISFFSGIIIMLLSMIGEYLSVVLLQTLGTPAYRESLIIKNGQYVKSKPLRNWSS